jgi:3-oxoacyl-[acyl-carrier protein] reductase
VLITGGSRGIGKATARAFASEGANLAICARGQEQLEATAEELRAMGVKVAAIPADVTIRDQVERFVATAAEQLGRVDVVVNNTGGRRGAGVLDTSDEDWQGSVEINFYSALYATRAAIPYLRKQGGAIVNVSSIYANEKWEGQLGYNAFKAALAVFGNRLAKDLIPDNIRVVAVAPGSILFPGGSWQRRIDADPEGMRAWIARELPSGRFGRPEEVASVIVFLASDKASWINGEVVRVDGLQSRWVF